MLGRAPNLIDLKMMAMHLSLTYLSKLGMHYSFEVFIYFVLVSMLFLLEIQGYFRIFLSAEFDIC